ERSVVDNWNQIVQQQLIPALNKQRALRGEPPVPPDFNYALSMFPEIVLNAGQSGQGRPAAWAKMLKVIGKDDEVTFGGTAARLQLDGNFWKLAEGVLNYVTHESAWRDTIEAVKAARVMESQQGLASTTKWLSWLEKSLDGRSVGPDMATLLGKSVPIIEKAL